MIHLKLGSDVGEAGVEGSHSGGRAGTSAMGGHRPIDWHDERDLLNRIAVDGGTQRMRQERSFLGWRLHVEAFVVINHKSVH